MCKSEKLEENNQVYVNSLHTCLDFQNFYYMFKLTLNF